MNNFYTRLSQLSEYKGFNSINEFALNGLNYASSEKLNRLKKENANPSVNILLDISNKFEDINIDWLLTGKGEMLRELSDNVGNEPKEKYIVATKNENCSQKIQFLEEQVKFYKEKSEFVERKLEDCEDEKKRNQTIR